MNDDALQKLCDPARSFHRLGYAFGSTGNLSVRLGDRVRITATGGSRGSSAHNVLPHESQSLKVVAGGGIGRPVSEASPRNSG